MEAPAIAQSNFPQSFDNIQRARPQTFAQWQQACTLVKYYHLQGEYQTCIKKADDLLQVTKVCNASPILCCATSANSLQLHEVHETVLNFYAALAHESLAEVLGHDHPEFHSHLNSAEQHLCAARNCLPTSSGANSEIKPPSESQARNVSFEAFKRDVASQQRSSSESSRPSIDSPSYRDSKSSRTTAPSPTQDNAEDESNMSGARGRYSRILLSLKPEFDSHITYIRALRQDSTEILSRSNSRAGDTADLQDTLAKVAVKQRVADGRKRNWKRTRSSLAPIVTE